MFIWHFWCRIQVNSWPQETLAFLGYSAKIQVSVFEVLLDYYIVDCDGKNLKLLYRFCGKFQSNSNIRIEGYSSLARKFKHFSYFYTINYFGHICRAWLLENRPAIKVCLVTHSKLFCGDKIDNHAPYVRLKSLVFVPDFSHVIHWPLFRELAIFVTQLLSKKILDFVIFVDQIRPKLISFTSIRSQPIKIDINWHKRPKRT